MRTSEGCDPTNVFAIDDIRLVTNFEVDPVLASEEDIDRLIQSLDGQSGPTTGGDMQNALQDLNGIGASLPVDPAAVEEEDNVQIKADDAPIIRVINVAITLDERISDGFYFARSLKRFRFFLEHPDELEKPAMIPDR